MIETTRTTAGYNLYNQLAKTMHYDVALDETRRRVEVRAERTSNDVAHVWTRVDGGAWIDEGMYRVTPLADVDLPPDADDYDMDAEIEKLHNGR